MPATASQPRKPLILVVDDDRFVRKIFQDALEAAGYLVTAVGDGETALTSLREAPQDLVLLDLVLPGRDGLQICQELRTLPLCQMIPALMITGTGDPDMVNRAFEAGATDFVTKRAACLQAKSWAAQGHADLRVAVNISAKQISQPDFLQNVASMVQQTGVAPGSLEFEFTESAVMEKADRNINTLRALKEMGIKVSIDDFGTGYSSLNYLKHFPIDTIKIDRYFIADVSSNSDDAAITEAIISMAHSLQLKVIAEGVESEEQLRFLELRNCDEVQGFYLGAPMPACRMSGELAKPGRRSALMRPRIDPIPPGPVRLKRPVTLHEEANC